MSLLGARLYDPVTAVTRSTAAALAMTALDTTNLRLTFTAPASGAVLVSMDGVVHGAATYPQLLLLRGAGGIGSAATVAATVSAISRPARRTAAACRSTSAGTASPRLRSKCHRSATWTAAGAPCRIPSA